MIGREEISHIQPHMRVVCSEDGQFALVDHVDGNNLKLTRDRSGAHHYIPLSWITYVDEKVHVDRPGRQVMEEWSTQPM